MTTPAAKTAAQTAASKSVYNNNNNNNNAASGTANTSSASLPLNDPRTAELRSFANIFEKMSDARLDKQRYIMSGNKTEEVGKIALGAKLDRALSRRMVGQDATFRTDAKTESIDEKTTAPEVKAN